MGKKETITINRKIKTDRETKTVLTVTEKPPKIDIDRCFKLECVSKEEFDAFIKEYPCTLTHDWFMNWTSYNDFTFGEWPYSVVAMESDGLYDEPICYKIARKALQKRS